MANLNDDCFVDAALNPVKRDKLILKDQSKRNIYLVSFGLGVIGVFLSLYSNRPVSAFAPTFVSFSCFVLFARYDTRLKMLKIIRIHFFMDS